MRAMKSHILLHEYHLLKRLKRSPLHQKIDMGFYVLWSMSVKIFLIISLVEFFRGHLSFSIGDILKIIILIVIYQHLSIKMQKKYLAHA